MPSFSKRSADNLATCAKALQDVFNKVVAVYDCTVIEGYRPKDRQDKAVAEGKSKTPWPNSRHNASPSEAADVAPYLAGRGIPWPQAPSFLSGLSADQKAELNQYVKDTAQFYHFAGYVDATAQGMGVRLRWGGDWDRDYCFTDQTFDDLPHFEIHRG